MQVVLRSGAGDELVERSHLGGHFFYLGGDDADGFVMDGFGGVLDFYSAWSDRLDHEG